MNSKSSRTERRRRLNEATKLIELIRSRPLKIGPTPKVLLGNANVDILVDEDSNIAEDVQIEIIDNSEIERHRRNPPSLSLPDSLRVWATTHNVTHTSVRDLISILNPHVNNILPLDPRTLMKTPRSIKVEKIGGGEFVYFGIRGGITRLLNQDLTYCNFPIVAKMQADTRRRILSISVGIDGVPISNSSTKSFWPILGILNQAKMSPPFIIGIFCGMSKPTDTIFLKKFVDEALVRKFWYKFWFGHI